MRTLLGALIFGVLAWGQGNCPAPVAGNADGNYIVPGSQGDIAYANGLTMDAYAPAGDPRPAALVIHGSRGDKRGYITSIYEQLTRDGYAWFAPNFRNADGDVAAALAFIRCPGRFNITGKMVLIGDDTGAQTALKLAAAGGIAGVIAVSAKLNEDADKALKIDAPVLMIHGTEDEQWPFAKAQTFCGQLKNCTVYQENGARHVFENWFPSQWDYKEEMDAWLAGDRRGLWNEIPFARPDGRALTMNAYIPRGPGPFPAVIVAHGGGWEGGDKVVYVPPIFKPLAKAGFAWFSIDYRLLPYVHNPEQIEDMRAAIRYVKQHAARYHVDAGKIAIFGESASGQMVAQIGAEACPGCEVQAIVSFYGVYKFEEGGRQGPKLEAMFGADRTAETLRRYSPLYAVRAGMPPALVVQGDKDPLLAGSNEYVEKLKQAGVPHEYVVVHGAPHGIENWEGHPEWSFYKEKVVDWLKTTLDYRAKPADFKSKLSAGNGQCPVEGDTDGDYIVSGTVADVPYGNGQTMDIYAPPGGPRPVAIVIRGRHGNQFNFVTKLYEHSRDPATPGSRRITGMPTMYPPRFDLFGARDGSRLARRWF
jgi:acetyl esterase